MRVGIPKEIKADENRVALTPAGAHELARRGHEVLVEAGAGLGSGFGDEEYEAVGAEVASTEAVWEEANLIVKVKEPIASEYPRLRDDLILFTYLHLAADESLTRALLDAGTTAVAYETVELPDGRLPLLAPMSEIAGRLTAQTAASLLVKNAGGRGVLLGGVPGVAPGAVTILGGGTAGYNAAVVTLGLGAQVRILERSINRLRHLDEVLGGRVELLMSSALEIERAAASSDVVIGAVLVAGARAPHVVTRETVAAMRPGSVVCDIAIDQGGCVETARPTSHSDPTYLVDGIVHSCIANLPGAVPVTATRALTNATLEYVLAIADGGVAGAAEARPELAAGINTTCGKLTCRAVAEAHDLEGEWHPPLESALAA